MTELLCKTLEPFGVILNEKQLEQFRIYAELLKEWNEKINLTAIVDDDGIAVKHFADSLTIVPTIQNILAKSSGQLTLADIGTGAGFPGIPLKIFFPELKVYLVDSLEKRLVFLREVIDKLGLTGIETVHARAEDIGRDKKFRDNIDIVTARAVAQLPTLLEYTLPLVKKGGYFVAMKGNKEDTDIKHALSELSGSLCEKKEFFLTANDENMARTIYIFKKNANTKGLYPRKAGIPSKKPL